MKTMGLIGTLLLTPQLAATLFAQPAGHPLDPLSARELWAVFEAMKASGKLDATSHYSSVSLREPPKAEVLAWKPGLPFRREALVVGRQAGRAYEAVVDVAGRRLVAFKEVEGVQPNLTEAEMEAAHDEVKENPEWIAAMRRRGIQDFETVECGGSAPGFFGTPEERGRRLQRLTCSEGRGSSAAYSRPIGGLVVVWDVDAKKVLRVIDAGTVPLPPAGQGDYDAEAIGPERRQESPIRMEQPGGPGFQLDGHQVTWQNWRFHFRIEPRVGVVVSLVRIADGERLRSVLYQASLSEIFVPYMDPSEGWYHTTYLDAGEFGDSEGLLKPMERDVDCPRNAVYFDALLTDDKGIPRARPRSACLFEREAGEIAWRHYDGPEAVVSRTRRDLVLRSVASLGNYDYVFDWVFQQDGTLRVSVGATGIVAVKAATARTAADTPGGRGDPYGHYVAAHTVAVNHDHFFSYRLDLDVDGGPNSFLMDALVPRRLPEGSLRKSLWVVEPRMARTESDAMLDASGHSPQLLRVINDGARGALGYPTSYEVRPGHNAAALLAADDYPQRRAGFTNHMIWVTPQRDDERYAAGDYPTQSQGGDGLPRWTSANRSIENRDIVVWYTIGFHHPVRAEDWPVMPVASHEFELRPFDFFQRNPALDLPSRP